MRNRLLMLIEVRKITAKYRVTSQNEKSDIQSEIGYHVIGYRKSFL